MKVLDNRTVYLSGAIEYQRDIDWRTPVKEVLTKEFNIHVFDPHQDPKQSKSDLLNTLRDEGKWDELSAIAHEFVRVDLSIVDHSDFLIANLPYGIPTTGTHHEIINSNNAKKPTLLVCEQKKIPFWYFGIIRHQFMFGSWNALYDYLREVNDLKHTDNDRWFFVYHYFLKEGHWALR
jgi:nucleoside 2-deoxyribosyltransferase